MARRTCSERMGVLGRALGDSSRFNIEVRRKTTSEGSYLFRLEGILAEWSLFDATNPPRDFGCAALEGFCNLTVPTAVECGRGAHRQNAKDYVAVSIEDRCAQSI